MTTPTDNQPRAPAEILLAEDANGVPPPLGPGARIRNYFLTGLIVTGPLAITAYLTW